MRQKYQLGQTVYLLKKGIFETKWYRTKDMFELHKVIVTSARFSYGVMTAEGLPYPTQYTLCDDAGEDIPNHDFGRREYSENEICASKKEAVLYLAEQVDNKIEELKEVKQDLLNTIEDENERPKEFINGDLFDLSG